MTQESLLRAADAAYATYYPQTDPKFTGKERAWRGEPEKNPLLRPLRAALAVIEEERAMADAIAGPGRHPHKQNPSDGQLDSLASPPLAPEDRAEDFRGCI